MSYSVDIKGMNELVAKLEKLPEQVKGESNGILQRGAEVFVLNAKRDAAKNFGFLTGQISFYPNPVKNLSVTLTSGALYSPYVEWGTITRVKVPAELQPYAIQFKGRGIRKTGGMFPRPFFFKQLPLAKATIEKGFESMLKDVKL